MDDDGEYELLPHEELEELRNELHKIKRNPIQGYKEADDLKSSIDKLTSGINNLITLFSNTNDELVDTFKKTTIEEHFSQISSQNEQIAQGILAVAKLVEDTSSKSSQSETNSQTDMSSSQELSSSIPLSIEPPMPAEQLQPLSGQAPSLSEDGLPSLDNPSGDIPSLQEPHPLNSKNLAIPNPNMGSDLGSSGMDLPPPPEKKKGLLGMFK